MCYPIRQLIMREHVFLYVKYYQSSKLTSLWEYHCQVKIYFILCRFDSIIHTTPVIVPSSYQPRYNTLAGAKFIGTVMNSCLPPCWNPQVESSSWLPRRLLMLARLTAYYCLVSKAQATGVFLCSGSACCCGSLSHCTQNSPWQDHEGEDRCSNSQQVHRS